MATRVVVAMSGGVDSAVAAALLRDAGHEVVGITMRLWPRSMAGASAQRYDRCCSPSAVDDARQVAAHLGIPHYLFDFEREFEARVIAPFADAYARGRTPNPCVACNQELKFGALLQRALALEADRVATGHYARVGRDPATGRATLRRGADRQKDQSYFLAGLTSAQLARALMPLGELSKAETRRLAAAYGLRVADKPESQEICFVPGDYRALLMGRIPDAFRPGAIRDLSGTVVGEHRGLPLYTVGQRRGLGLGGPRPRYAVRLDAARNELVVGEERDLHISDFVAAGMNFLAWDGRGGERRVLASVRYRQGPVPGRIRALPGGRALVRLDRPVRAVTPGQAVVLYDAEDAELVVGGGTIERVLAGPGRIPPPA
jgi:tRNA-specific 2-thiouridylase